MRDGTSDCAFNQWFRAIARESAFSDSHGKSPEHEILFKLAELVKVRVVASDGLAILSPMLPSSSPVVV